MNRLRSLTLLLALVAAALVAVGCGDDKKASTTATAASSGEAKAALIAALKNAAALKTGNMELAGEFGFTGGATASFGKIKLDGSGPFDVSDPKQPKLKLTIKIGIAGQVQKVIVTIVDGKAYVEFNGQAIELSGKSMKSIEQLTNGLGPQAIAQLSKDLETNVTDVKAIGTVKAGDLTLTKYSAKIDFPKLVESFGKSGEGKSLFGGLAGQDPEQIKNAFKAKKVEFGVDEQAQVVRLLAIDAEFADPTGAQEGKGTITIAIKLLPADGPIEITAPANAVKGDDAALGGLLGAFGGGGQ